MAAFHKSAFNPPSVVHSVWPCGVGRDEQFSPAPEFVRGIGLNCKRICVAVLGGIALLLAIEALGRYLPQWLSLMAVPTSLSGGEFIVAGFMLGLLLAAGAVLCLTALFYLAFRLYAELSRQQKRTD